MFNRKLKTIIKLKLFIKKTERFIFLINSFIHKGSKFMFLFPIYHLIQNSDIKEISIAFLNF